MEDMLEEADEIQETLGRSYGMPEIDEADLDAGLSIAYLCWFDHVYPPRWLFNV